MRAWLIGCLVGVGVGAALACSGGATVTGAALAYPPELSVAVSEATPTILARWPACTLTGWTLTPVAAPFVPPPGTLCGTTPCRGLVRGNTDTRTRTITVWTLDPFLTQVVAWEACSACRWEATRTLEDRGCA